MQKQLTISRKKIQMNRNDEFQIPEIGREILADPLKLQKHAKNGEVLQEIVGYSDNTMHKFFGGMLVGGLIFISIVSVG